MKTSVAVAKDKALRSPLLGISRKKKIGIRTSTRDLESQADEDDSDDDDDLEEENGNVQEGEEGSKKKLTRKFLAVAGACAGALVFNIASLVTMGLSATSLLSATTIAAAGAGIVGAVIAPIAYFREKNIVAVSSRRGQINAIRQQVNQLKKQNKRVGKSRKTSRERINKMKEVETKLELIVEKNGASVDEFLDLLAENQKLMDKMKFYFDAKVIQDIVRIIIRYDKDKDFMLSSREMPMLIYALKSFDVNITDVGKFKKDLTDKSVPTAIQYVDDILKQQYIEAVAKDKYLLSKPDTMSKFRKVLAD